MDYITKERLDQIRAYERGAMGVYVDDRDPNRMVQLTRPGGIPPHLWTIRYFVNPTYGINMAVDASIGGAGENVYDGGDNTYWTFSLISGDSGDFIQSTTQNHTPAGVYSLNFSPSEPGDSFALTKPSGMLNTSDFSALEHHWYFTAWAGGDSEIYVSLWNTSTGLQVGGTVDLSGYINVSNLNAWQDADIPIEDFITGAHEFNQVRYEIYGNSVPTAPAGFLDDVSFLTATGAGPLVYTIQTGEGDKYLLNRLNFMMSADYDGSGGLEYDKFLNQTLSNRITYRQYHENEIVFSYSFSTLYDMAQTPGAIFEPHLSTTKCMLRILFDFPAEEFYDYDDGDYLQIVLNDDMTGFTNFNINAGVFVLR